MKHIDEHLARKLAQRKQEDNLRQLTAVQAPIDFCSNDYLGLAANGLLTSSTDSTENSQWTGSTGSRLLSGNSAAAEALEGRIAAFHGTEAALLFNSGYDANIGLLSCIVSRDSVILSDELCHASLIDGIRLSQCNSKYKFRHNDLADLEDKLQRHTTRGPIIVVVESVYSMDGDIAPLDGLTALCERYNASLVVDEAHATGIFGPHGEGLVQAMGLQDKVFARIHTFGKALGCHGAAVAGSDLLKQYLINFARPFIYSTALPGHAIHTIGKAYEHLASRGFTNQPIHDLIAYFRMQINKKGAAGWMYSESPIQALVTADNNKARQLAGNLQQAGMQVKPILHPTVPAGMERLRICLHTFNTKGQIDLLFETLYPKR